MILGPQRREYLRDLTLGRHSKRVFVSDIDLVLLDVITLSMQFDSCPRKTVVVAQMFN